MQVRSNFVPFGWDRGGRPAALHTSSHISETCVRNRNNQVNVQTRITKQSSFQYKTYENQTINLYIILHYNVSIADGHKSVARVGRVYHRSDVRTVLRLRPYQSSSQTRRLSVVERAITLAYWKTSRKRKAVMNVKVLFK